MTTSKKASKHKYRLFFLPQALEEWRDLDGSIRQNLKKLLAKRLDNPHVPGGELHGPLTSCYKIKLNKQGVRLVYEVEDDKLIVMVLAVDRREDSAAYKAAVDRLSASATALAKTDSMSRHASWGLRLKARNDNSGIKSAMTIDEPYFA